MRDDLSVSWDRAECLMQNYMRGCKNCQRGYTLIFGGNLIIDPIGRQVSLNGEELQLTRKERLYRERKLYSRSFLL